MVILSYVLQTVSTLLCISALLIKGKNMNLIQIILFSGNVVGGVGYLFAGPTGINAAVSCILAGVQSLINYSFQSRNKPIPKWLIAIHALSLIVLNIAVSGITLPCMFAIISAMFFVLSIVQSSGRMFRVWTFFNNVTWITYDLVAETYSGLIIHVTMFVFTLVGMILHDRKKKEKTAE